MSVKMTTNVQTNTAPVRGVVRRLIQVGVVLLVQALALFLSAGRLDWVAGWVFIGVYLGVVAMNGILLLPRHSEMIAERGRVGQDAKRWDKVLAGMVSFYVPLFTLIAAGLDVRAGGSAPPALAVQLGALAVMVLGYALVSWAMVSNAFFSGVVRIQTDRGHTVATAGPYRHARHPGYGGMMMVTLATPLLLGSLWALAPAALNLGLFVLRTALEDSTLQNELPGYRDYAARVRYRLLPGVW